MKCFMIFSVKHKTYGQILNIFPCFMLAPRQRQMVLVMPENIARKRLFIVLWFISVYVHCPKNKMNLRINQCVYTVPKIKFKSVCVHCPKNKMNLRIKTEPVTVGADATVCSMSGFCLHTETIHILVPLQLLQPWQARFLCWDLDYFWDSVGKVEVRGLWVWICA